MSKNVRIIPRLDIKSQNVIKGVHLECLRIVGQPGKMAERYYNENADEIIYLDTVASLYGRDNLVNIVSIASQNIFVPLTAGGGVRSLEDINKLLRAGADKVTINTHATKHQEFITAAAQSFGSQCIVGHIEAKKTKPDYWEVYVENGRQPTGLDAVKWAKQLENLGAGELLVTSIDQDGTYQGFDYELAKKITAEVSIPVIISGGAGSKEDIAKVINESKVDAIAIASLLHYQKETIPQIKKYLCL